MGRVLAWLVLFLSSTAQAMDIVVSWAQVTEDTNGDPLDPSVIEYQIWADGGGGYTNIASTNELSYTFYDVDASAGGRDVSSVCYSVYMKAIRTDTGQTSAPSEVVYRCLDGSGGDGDTPPVDTPSGTYPPRPPVFTISSGG